MVRYIQPKDRPTEINVRSATGDGSTTGFTVTQKPTTDYTISGTTLTFGTAPAASDVIVIRELPI